MEFSPSFPPRPVAGDSPSVTMLSPLEVRRRLTAIEEELEDLRQVDPPSFEAIAPRLAHLEQRFQALAHRVERDEPGDPERVGVPLLDEALAWRRLGAEYALPVKPAAEVAERIFGDGVEAFIDQGQARFAATALDPEFLLERLLQVSNLTTEMLDLGIESKAEAEALRQERRRLRSTAEALFDKARPNAELASRYSLGLLDQADTLLAMLDEFPPLDAARRLEAAADDLAWHRRHVERDPVWRRRLRRKLGRLRLERVERILDHRLDTLFGRRGHRRLERFFLIVLICMLGNLAVPWLFGASWSPAAAFRVDVFDALCCLILLGEFFLKLALVPERRLWFRRHWLFGLLPSIPFGLLGHIPVDPRVVGEGVFADTLLRVLQLPRLLRFFELVRPLIRVVRFFGLLTRGLDRLARQSAGLLNRNIILFPTRQERLELRSEIPPASQACRKLRTEFGRRWQWLLDVAPAADRPRVYAARLDVLRAARMRGFSYRARIWREHEYRTRELSAPRLLRRLTRATPADMEAALGELPLRRTARVFSILAAPPIRWFPLVSWIAPTIKPGNTPAEIVAAGMQRIGGLGLRYYHLQYFLADLYGTVTPSQLVDQLGTLLMKNSYKPVHRMFVAGVGFWALTLLLQILPIKSLEFLERHLETLGRTVGTALFIIGGLALLTLGLGFWLRRLAQEASEYYERAVRAQFLSLTETIRCRSLGRDAAIVYNRVLRPESRLFAPADPLRERDEYEQLRRRVEKSLLGIFVAGDAAIPFSSMERAVMLFRDSLDGAMLTDDDARTTYQLLGNPSLQQFLALSERTDPPRLRDLEKLDVNRMRSLLWGPFLWYSFLSRAVCQSVARLIIDYNRHAVPLNQLSLAIPHEKERLRRWLDLTTPDPGKARRTAAEMNDFVTTFFTAMHFLDDDAARDEEVRLRFGPEVHARLLRDRALTLRQIFGCYPLHKLPKEQRLFNPYRFYENTLARGQALLLPWYFLEFVCENVWKVSKFVWRSIEEIRRPQLRVEQVDAADADFHTAARKIGRMRHPLVQAATDLRIKFDPEYLGATIPGCPRVLPAEHGLDADLPILDPTPDWSDRIRAERERAEADMERLGKLLDDGLAERIVEHLNLDDVPEPRGELLRAAGVAYLADLNGVRRCLSGLDVLHETFERAAQLPLLPASPIPQPKNWLRFRQYAAIHGKHWTKRSRLAAWRALVHNVWGAAECLDAWIRLGDLARPEGEARLAMLLRHPSRISEQLVTLRSVQTLSLLDVLNYREHIYRLGCYAAQGDPPDELFGWGNRQSSM